MLSRISLTYATLFGLPGIRFGWFGVWCSRRLQKAGYDDLAQLLSITPVNCVRYFEFDFARRKMFGAFEGCCLDVSSPRLFSLYVAKNSSARVDIINPDLDDIKNTQKIVDCLQLHDRVLCRNIHGNKLPWPDEMFNRIWSISVLEHIPEPEDIRVLKEIWRVLCRGGVLVLTLPVSLESRDEFRAENVYGLERAASNKDGMFFFQRWYDELMLKERVIDALSGSKEVVMEIYGEKHRGWFQSYLRRWEEYGESVTCFDPFLMAARITQLKDMRSLRNCGIACLSITKLFSKS